MMAEARVVLLDEIAAGVNRTLLNDLAAVIERLNREHGLTFFVIEHDMDLIARLCDPVIVMAAGSVMMQGPMAEIRSNPEVIEAYFGGARRAEAGADRDSGRFGPIMPKDVMASHAASMPAMAAPTSSTASTSPSRRHEIGVIVGPNGAGKSTTLKALFGLLDGQPRAASSSTARTITNSPPESLVREGLSFVPQEFNVFPTHDGAGEPRDGRLYPARRFPPPDRPDLRLLPAAEGQAPAAGRRTVGRPAPDGGDRPRADDASRSCCCSTSRPPACRRATWARSSSASSRSTSRASAS